MVIGAVVAILAPCGDASFRVTDDGGRVWEAPSGGWRVFTKFVTRDLDRVERFMENKPPEQEAGRMFELILRERGVWMGFSIQFGRVKKVVFTKSTKVVLIDKAGKRYESDGCFFYPDAIQSRVFDSRKSAIVVTMKSVAIYPKSGLPLMEVKFPEGAFRLKDLVEFEVVGAVEDTS
jgi:hypothetical protein